MSTKKRICHISTVHPLSDVRIFYRECVSLACTGYEVHLVIPAGKSEVRDGVHVHPLPRVKSRLLRMLIMPWVALSSALRTRSVLYHYHDPELIFMGFILRWVFFKKVVFDIHESVVRQIVSKPYLPKFAKALAPFMYSSLERIFTIGQALVVANKNSVPDYSTRKIQLVQNYPLVSVDVDIVTKEWSSKASTPLLVYVGGVSKIRGGESYVELAQLLNERGYEYRMQIIGPYDRQFGTRIHRRIAELGLQDRVVLLGRMPWPEAMKVVAQAHIGMCLLMPVPNYTTCLATKILEYMMLGTPVLASDFNCWREYVEGERVGRMADPTDIEQVADTCQQMLDDPGELSQMAVRGIEAVRSKYNWTSEFRSLLACYGELLGEIPEKKPSGPLSSEVGRTPRT